MRNDLSKIGRLSVHQIRAVVLYLKGFIQQTQDFSIKIDKEGRKLSYIKAYSKIKGAKLKREFLLVS